MIFDRAQLEQVINECFERLNNFKDIRITGLLSGPSCGKTTLIEAVQLASCNVGGFVITDMSQIMDWHLDPKNKSPLRESFASAEQARKRGDLIDDHLIFAGFLAYLLHEQEHSVFSEIRKALVSGLPRKAGQGALLLEHFPLFRMAYIDCPQEEANRRRLKRIAEGIARDDDKHERFENRWVNFYSETEPVVNSFSATYPDRFTVIDYRRSPHQKALLLLKSMRLKEDEHRSLYHQLITPTRKAWQRLDRVLNPAKYSRQQAGQSRIQVGNDLTAQST